MQDYEEGHLIKAVEPGSIGDDIGLVPGDRLLKINGLAIKDILDYKFQISDCTIFLLVKKKGGEHWEIEIEKDEDEGLGLIFEHYTLEPPKLCRNNCIFCFVDQLPQGMRPSLYVKDDDYRLSFMEGNYITLTNLNDQELHRLEKYALSPIYVSIHATDPSVRQYMLNNKNAGDIMQKLRRLTRANIKIHGQIVLCPGVNDEIILNETIKDLSTLWPQLQSVAIVPVGLTKYRRDLVPIKKTTPAWAKSVIEQVSTWQKRFLADRRSRFVFLADDFYLIAARPFPNENDYEGYPQIENGVGLARQFLTEYTSWCKSLPRRSRDLAFSIVTSKSAYKLLKLVINDLKNIKGLSPYLHVIHSNFWGDTVTVAGLLTGKDLIHSLKGHQLGSLLIIPDIMLKENTNVFLDDLTYQELEQELKVKIVPVENLKSLSDIIFNYHLY